MDVNSVPIVQMVICIPIFIAIAMLLKREFQTIAAMQHRTTLGSPPESSDDYTGTSASEFSRNPMHSDMSFNIWHQNDTSSGFDD